MYIAKLAKLYGISLHLLGLKVSQLVLSRDIICRWRGVKYRCMTVLVYSGRLLGINKKLLIAFILATLILECNSSACLHLVLKDLLEVDWCCPAVHGYTKTGQPQTTQISRLRSKGLSCFFLFFRKKIFELQ